MKAYLFMLITTLVVVFALNQAMSSRGADERLNDLARRQTPADLLVAPGDYDARSLVRERLLESGHCVDVLVLGSSTVGHFAAEMFPGKTILNAWMGGPTIEDFEALAFVMRKMSCEPATIVIGVDPWWIGNPQVDEQRWVPLFKDYVGYHADEVPLATLRYGIPVAWNVFKDRLTYATTGESLYALYMRIRQQLNDAQPRLERMSPEQFCGTIHGEYSIRSYDGHYTTCPVFTKTPEEVTTIARSYLSRNMHRMGSWTSVAGDRISRLGAFLKDWSRHARVVMVGIPYHPVTFALLSSDPTVGPNLRETDQRLEAAARASGARFLNLRDASLAGCTSTEFEDSHHPSASCIAKVAARILALDP